MPQVEYNRSDTAFLSKKLFGIEDGKIKIFNERNIDIDSKNPWSGLKCWPESSGKQFFFTNDQIKSVFSLGENVLFVPNGHLDKYELIVQRNGKRVNIVDLGFGTANLISLLLCIDIAGSSYRGSRSVETKDNKSVETRKKKFVQNVILCEEPELSLHPNFQSKLADVFVSAFKQYGINFILETHSEYIIRKLQYLVAKKQISPKEIAIYYFPSGTDKATPYKIGISEDGRLSKPFGKGFYDESSRIMMNILSGETIN